MTRKLSARATAAGLRVEKFIEGYAYARNGNAHNPTPRISWLLKDANGDILDVAYKLGDLLSTADEFLSESC